MKMPMKVVILLMTFVSARTSIITLPSGNCCGWDDDDDPIKMYIFNFQEEAIFPVTSSLLYSANDAVLFDAQFSLKQANEIVNYLHDTDTILRRIIITCGDPDYYFGLQAIVEAFPSVEIVASPKVANYINQTKDDKLKFWAPQLANNAPDKIFVPKPIDESTFYVADKKVVWMRELDSYAAYVWIPNDKLIFGGVGIFWRTHVWTADTPTPNMRLNWRQVLEKMIDLRPKIVVPGHFISKRPMYGDSAIRFTLEYLESLELVLLRNDYKNSTAVINYMKERFPCIGGENNLELSAKVLTGEMKL